MRYEGLFEEGSLWVVIAAPTVWAAHFLVSYWGAAVWCARFAGEDDGLFWARMGILALTAAALGVEFWLGQHAWRRYGGRLRVDDELTRDTELERTRFMGHATLLLVGLSMIAILFDAMPALMFSTCR
jgi:hypothetical protein